MAAPIRPSGASGDVLAVAHDVIRPTDRRRDVEARPGDVDDWVEALVEQAAHPIAGALDAVRKSRLVEHLGAHSRVGSTNGLEECNSNPDPETYGQAIADPRSPVRVEARAGIDREASRAFKEGPGDQEGGEQQGSHSPAAGLACGSRRRGQGPQRPPARRA